MKHGATTYDEPKEDLVLVPYSFLAELKQGQERIIVLLEKNPPVGNGIPGGYIPEQVAQDLLGRKTTWFWQMRSSGQLAFTKVGNRVFYAKADIQRLLDNHRQEGGQS